MMKAKFINEAIKHLPGRSQEELEQNYADLNPAEKLLKGFEYGIKDLVKRAMKEDNDLKEIGKLFLANEVISIGMDTCVGIKKRKIDPNGEIDESYFLDFLSNHSIKYKVLQVRGPGGGLPFIEYTGKARDLIKLIIGPFDCGLDGYDEIEELKMYLGLEEDEN